MRSGQSIRSSLPEQLCVGRRQQQGRNPDYEFEPGRRNTRALFGCAANNASLLPCRSCSWHEPGVDAPYAIAEPLEPGVARLLARNPSPFTYFGTQTYLVGEEELVVIDPGPDLPEHVDAIVDGARRAARWRRSPAPTPIATIRPASRALKEATGAPIIGCAPLALESIGPRADASFDKRLCAGPGAGRRRSDRVRRRQAADRGGDARAYQQPSLLRLWRRAVHRRSCDGLVDHRGRAARRRHGAPTCRASTCCGSAATASTIRRTARR